MRRSANEIIRNLEKRIARLEANGNKRLARHERQSSNVDQFIIRRMGGAITVVLNHRDNEVTRQGGFDKNLSTRSFSRSDMKKLVVGLQKWSEGATVQSALGFLDGATREWFMTGEAFDDFFGRQASNRQAKMSYNRWMAKVDAIVEDMIMMSVHDLVDYDTHGLWEDGVSPKRAARIIIENDGTFAGML